MDSINKNFPLNKFNKLSSNLNIFLLFNISILGFLIFWLKKQYYYYKDIGNIGNIENISKISSGNPIILREISNQNHSSIEQSHNITKDHKSEFKNNIIDHEKIGTMDNLEEFEEADDMEKIEKMDKTKVVEDLEYDENLEIKEDKEIEEIDEKLNSFDSIGMDIDVTGYSSPLNIEYIDSEKKSKFDSTSNYMNFIVQWSIFKLLIEKISQGCNQIRKIRYRGFTSIVDLFINRVKEIPKASKSLIFHSYWMIISLLLNLKDKIKLHTNRILCYPKRIFHFQITHLNNIGNDSNISTSIDRQTNDNSSQINTSLFVKKLHTHLYGESEVKRSTSSNQKFVLLKENDNSNIYDISDYIKNLSSTSITLECPYSKYNKETNKGNEAIDSNSNIQFKFTDILLEKDFKDQLNYTNDILNLSTNYTDRFIYNLIKLPIRLADQEFLYDINNNFLSNYKHLKNIILHKLNTETPVMLIDESIGLFSNCSRLEKFDEAIISSLSSTPMYLLSKVVDHIPLNLFSLAKHMNLTQEDKTISGEWNKLKNDIISLKNENEDWLNYFSENEKSHENNFLNSLNSINENFVINSIPKSEIYIKKEIIKWKNLTERCDRILKKTLDLFELDKESILCKIEEFTNSIRNDIEANITCATQSQLDHLLGIFLSWRKQYPQLISKCHVIIRANHFAMKENILRHFFEVLKSQGLMSTSQKVVVSDANDTRDLKEILATAIIDSEISKLFFGNESRMNQDLLSPAAKSYFHKDRIETHRREIIKNY